MVQLSLLDQEPLSLGGLLDLLSSECLERFGAAIHIGEARRVVSSHFASWSERGLTPAECRRVRAYFGGVLRRRLMRAADPTAVSARRLLVVAAIEADLREAGWRDDRAAEEARRVAGLERGLSGVA